MNNRIIFLLSSLIVLMLSCFSLDSFLFEPTRVTEYLRPEDMDTSWHVRLNVIPDSLIIPVELTSQGNRIYGFFVKSNGNDSINNKVTIIYCHGKSENINRYWGRVELLWEMGFQVFIFDYQGYGKSEGTPSASACYSDGRAALDYCKSRQDVDTSKIVYYGWSLGSFIATYLASDVRSPLALILEAPIASTSAVTRENTLLDIPGRYVANADFDNEKRIANIGAPLLIIHGKKDDTAVFHRHATVLYDKAKAPKQNIWLPEAGHSNIPETMGSQYAQTIKDFIRGCLQ